MSSRVSQRAKLPDTSFTMVISEQCSLHEKASYEMTDFFYYFCLPFSPFLLLPLFTNSDCQSTLDGLADDSEEDICAGTQLSAADYCPHR